MDMNKFVQESQSEDLKAKDFIGKTMKLRIEKVSTVTYPANDKQPEQTKACLHFVGKDKKLVLNSTNTETLISAFSAEGETWVGKDISLTTKDYTAEGFGHGWIVAALNPDFDDDIPF